MPNQQIINNFRLTTMVSIGHKDSIVNLFILVRIASVFYSIIPDCDEGMFHSIPLSTNLLTKVQYSTITNH